MTDKVLQLPRLGEILDGEDPQDGDRRFWSVTTIIDQINKPALVPWAAKQTALEAVLSQAWAHMPEGDAIKWLSAARRRPPVGAELEDKDLGSAVHVACQHKAIHGQWPDIVHAETRPFLRQFDLWLDIFQPTYEAAEVVVYHPDYGYAGTLDAIMVIDGVRILVDYKTSREPLNSKGDPKKPYPETVLQLAAYRYAKFAAVWRARRYEHFTRRYYLLSPGEEALAYPMPEVDAAGCLLITPESCRLFPIRADRHAWQAFLYTMEVARWTLQDSRGSVGQAVDPPGTVAWEHKPLFDDFDDPEA